MMQEDSVRILAGELGMVLKGNDPGINKRLLAEKINNLIQTDFHKLVAILYRLDVSEEKTKKLLKENPDSDAGILITDLIIERQEQKIKSRQQFKQPDDTISDDEKW